MAGFGSHVRAQDEIAPGVSPPLVLTEAIPLAGVQGRFDHFGFDRKNQLFVAALGNNSVEVIDISARTRVHSITGIANPQGSSTHRRRRNSLRPAVRGSSLSMMQQLLNS